MNYEKRCRKGLARIQPPYRYDYMDGRTDKQNVSRDIM